MPPREETEMRLTALLMGELSPEETSTLQAQMAADPRLAVLHARLRKAMELLREASALPEQAAPPAPVQLSRERRERLLAHFKTAPPRATPTRITPMPRRDYSWAISMSLAAALVAFIGVVFFNTVLFRTHVEPRFFITAQSRAPELNLFGRPRVTVWPVRAETATESSGPDFAAEASRVVHAQIAAPPLEQAWASQPGMIRVPNRSAGVTMGGVGWTDDETNRVHITSGGVLALPAPTIAAVSTTNVTTPTFQIAPAMPVVKAQPTDALSKALTLVPAKRTPSPSAPSEPSGRKFTPLNINGTLQANVGQGVPPGADAPTPARPSEPFDTGFGGGGVSGTNAFAGKIELPTGGANTGDVSGGEKRAAEPTFGWALGQYSIQPKADSSTPAQPASPIVGRVDFYSEQAVEKGIRDSYKTGNISNFRTFGEPMAEGLKATDNAGKDGASKPADPRGLSGKVFTRREMAGAAPAAPPTDALIAEDPRVAEKQGQLAKSQAEWAEAQQIAGSIRSRATVPSQPKTDTRIEASEEGKMRSSTLDLNGVVLHGGNTTLTGKATVAGGTLALSGNNTSTGGTTIGTGTLTINGGATTTISGVNSFTGGLTKSGSGNLAGAATSDTNGITLNAKDSPDARIYLGESLAGRDGVDKSGYGRWENQAGIESEFAAPTFSMNLPTPVQRSAGGLVVDDTLAAARNPPKVRIDYGHPIASDTFTSPGKFNHGIGYQFGGDSEAAAPAGKAADELLIARRKAEKDMAPVTRAAAGAKKQTRDGNKGVHEPSAEVEKKFQDLVLDLRLLAKTDNDAKAIVNKPDILGKNSASPSQISQQIAPSLLQDMAVASLKNDRMKALLSKHGYNVQQQSTPAPDVTDPSAPAPAAPTAKPVEVAKLKTDEVEKQRKLVEDASLKVMQIRARDGIIDPDPDKEGSNIGREEQSLAFVGQQLSEQQLRVVELERQAKLVNTLRPDELMQVLRELKIEDATVLKTLPLWQDASSEEARLLAAGLGENSQQIRDLRAQRESYTKILSDQFTSIRNAQANRLRFERDKLAIYEQRAGESQTNQIQAKTKVSEYIDAKNQYLQAKKILESLKVAKKTNNSETDEEVLGTKPEHPAAIPQPEMLTSANAFSTFSLNVSDVSFKLAAASLEQGQMPEPSGVRSEEFVNAFDYRDPEPAGDAPLACTTERARYPFAQNRDLLRCSVKTAAAGRQPGRALNLVLLLDNSGSMERADRVRIVREALRVLSAQLQPQDKLSVVTFARTPRLWADGVAGNKAVEVTARCSEITPQGGTNIDAALDLGYATALRHYQVGSINRVVLLTDGAANLGDVNPDALKQKVETHRKQGVALDCFGIGWEGLNDDLLEQLSRNGDGRYGFINTPEEAATEFAGQLAGALRVAASDVKVQVEFNPRRVTAYRQIGYAKHQLKKEQFRDNTVDAAEIGAAESGNALYVCEVNPRGEGDLATVRVRFKVPGTSDYREHEWAVPFTREAPPLEQASPALRLAGTAAAFAEWLVASPYATEVTSDRLLGLINGVPAIYGADPRPKKLEWMIRQAKSVSGR
jgi:Mg-chelatase subunit ChlD/anti-sigma factor RsiW